MLCQIKHLIILHNLGSRDICYALLQYKYDYFKIHQICPQMYFNITGTYLEEIVLKTTKSPSDMPMKMLRYPMGILIPSRNNIFM